MMKSTALSSAVNMYCTLRLPLFLFLSLRSIHMEVTTRNDITYLIYYDELDLTVLTRSLKQVYSQKRGHVWFVDIIVCVK